MSLNKDDKIALGALGIAAAWFLVKPGKAKAATPPAPVPQPGKGVPPVAVPSGPTGPTPVGPAATGDRPFLKIGSRGDAVREWQKLIGLTGKDVDGEFGPGTEKATKKWQAANGLIDDGKVGPLSWAKAKGDKLGGEGGDILKEMLGVQPSTDKGVTPGSSPYGDSMILPSGGAKKSGTSSMSLAEKVCVESGLTWDGSKCIDTPKSPTGGTSGRTFCQQLPKNATPERDKLILQALNGGLLYPYSFIQVVSEKNGHKCVFHAMNDCIRLGNTDPIRINLNHGSAQVLADMMGLVLPTSRMSDLAYQQAHIKLPVYNIAQNKLHLMGTVDEMIAHSDRVSNGIAKAGGSEGMLIRDVGKDWVNSERLLNGNQPATVGKSSIGHGSGIASANFGWHSSAAGLKSPGGLPVYQSVGLAHDMKHTDYSQVVTLYGAHCTVDGAERSVAEVLLNPDLAYLLSDEVQPGKAARVTRHPAIPNTMASV